MRAGAAGGLLATLLCCGAAVAAIPSPGGFAGETSQVYPDGSRGQVTIRMGGGGRSLKRFNITWLAPCDGGYVPLSQGTRAEGTLNRRGRFRGGGTYFSDSGNLAGTGYTATIRNRLRGRFVTARRAEGTFRATASLRDGTGQQVSTCSTGPVEWSARRR